MKDISQEGGLRRGVVVSILEITTREDAVSKVSMPKVV